MGKRSTLEKRQGIQAALEKHRRFDYDYISFGTDWTIPDEKYSYRPNFFQKISVGVIRTLSKILGPLFLKITYGAKVVGRKNLKALKGKGAISLSNHCSYVDALFTRQAVGYFRSYVTVAPWNNKTGFFGWFLRRGGILPFSSNLTATRNLWKRMDELLKKGKIINFYPEQAMWVNYQKPRPMKEGAFQFAVKYGVPIVPLFYTFKVNKKGHMRKLRIHVMPPIYADETLSKAEKIASMKAAAEAAWKKCYEEAYGMPLTYLEK